MGCNKEREKESLNLTFVKSVQVMHAWYDRIIKAGCEGGPRGCSVGHSKLSLVLTLNKRIIGWR